jgi:hypothetical protein
MTKTMKIALEGDPEPLEIDEPLMMREVLPSLVPYCTSIFGGPSREDPRVDYSGSGTFVTAGGSPSLLVAAHVWELMRSYEWIFLTLDAASTNVGRRPLAVERKVITPRFVTPRPQEGWRIEGPDLAILGIPELHASRARLQKAFYDLDKRRAEALRSKVRDHDGLWAVLGATSEQANLEEGVMNTTAFASRITGKDSRDGFDYLDLLIKREGRPWLPRSYRGISGAGLWRVDLRRSPDGVKCLGVSLEGVAFYQDFDETGLTGFLRCHGRESIYGRGMEASE